MSYHLAVHGMLTIFCGYRHPSHTPYRHSRGKLPATPTRCSTNLYGLNSALSRYAAKKACSVNKPPDKGLCGMRSSCEKESANNIKDFNSKSGDLVLVRTTAIEKLLNRKMRARYLGPLIVLAWNKGGAYIVAELDGSIFNRPAAVFHVIPYFVRTHIDLPPPNELLDISNHRLQELKDSEVSDPDEKAGDGFDEGSLDNTPQL